MPTALITGASLGLGRALAERLADRGWQLVIDARRPELLERARSELAGRTTVHAVAGDVSDPVHRAALVRAAEAAGALELVVNNASTLGASPQPPLFDLDPQLLARIYAVNVIAPLAIIQAVRPLLSDTAAVLNISSDAAVGHYAGWGGYGSAKAALDHLTATLAAEAPSLHWYALDPGDLRTDLHQAAFPGTDLRALPEPASVAGPVLDWLQRRPPSGRYRFADLATAGTARAAGTGPITADTGGVTTDGVPA